MPPAECGGVVVTRWMTIAVVVLVVGVVAILGIQLLTLRTGNANGETGAWYCGSVGVGASWGRTPTSDHPDPCTEDELRRIWYRSYGYAKPYERGDLEWLNEPTWYQQD